MAHRLNASPPRGPAMLARAIVRLRAGAPRCGSRGRAPRRFAQIVRPALLLQRLDVMHFKVLQVAPKPCRTSSSGGPCPRMRPAARAPSEPVLGQRGCGSSRYEHLSFLDGLLGPVMAHARADRQHHGRGEVVLVALPSPALALLTELMVAEAVIDSDSAAEC